MLRQQRKAHKTPLIIIFIKTIAAYQTGRNLVLEGDVCCEEHAAFQSPFRAFLSPERHLLVVNALNETNFRTTGQHLNLFSPC